MDGYKSFKEVEKFGNSGISNCPLGENIRINPFGWVYACLVIDDDRWTLGNILDADFNTAGNKVLSRLQDVSLNRFDENIECQKCVWYPFCRGGCMADAYLLNGDFNSADSLCTLKKSVLKKLFREQADN
jgi:radical SAM protein with 4Fe4S-binding SPASM domain